jgi:hypothetical protein
MLLQQLEPLAGCIERPPVQTVAQYDFYYVELSSEALHDQGCLLDSLISFTFDTLNVQHLDLRIVTDTH